MKEVKKHVIAGAAAGAVGRLLTAPLDVIKIRFQLQNIHKRKYISMFQTFRLIIKEEGIRSLWKGNIPATYLWITYSMCQFGSYGPLQKILSFPTPDIITCQRSDRGRLFVLLSEVWIASIPFTAGAAAGVLATVATYPFDIMRTQFALQGQVRVHTTMLSYVRRTLQTDGIRGFYAGLPAAVVGIAPFMGSNFFIYEHSMTLQKKLQGKYSVDSSSAFVKMCISGFCGSVAGGLSKLLMFPLDTVKKRLQAQVLLNSTIHLPVSRISVHPKLMKGSYHVGQYTGLLHCISSIYAKEGVTGFYKGIAPTMMKSIISTGITFAVFEGTKTLLDRQWI